MVIITIVIFSLIPSKRYAYIGYIFKTGNEKNMSYLLIPKSEKKKKKKKVLKKSEAIRLGSFNECLKTFKHPAIEMF